MLSAKAKSNEVNEIEKPKASVERPFSANQEVKQLDVHAIMGIAP